MSRSRSSPALRGLAIDASGLNEDGGSSNPSMHSADDVLVARSSSPLPDSTARNPSVANNTGVYDVGNGGRRLSWRANAAEAAVAGSGENSLSDGEQRGVRNRVTFTNEPEALSEEQEAQVYLDFRPYMDLAPTTVRQAPANTNTGPILMHFVLNAQAILECPFMHQAVDLVWKVVGLFDEQKQARMRCSIFTIKAADGAQA